MQLSDERIEEFKKIFKDQYGKEMTDEQAREASHNLVHFFELLYKISLREEKWKEKLKESPKGFAVPNNKGYSCRLCRITNMEVDYWYDQNTLKCPPCQKAIEEGVVPASVMHDEDTWVSMYDLQRNLDLHHATIRKMIRTGELKARIIQNNGHDYFHVFLKKENPKL